MGVNLVTRVRNFSIETRTFSASDHDVQDGCVTPGTHKLLRFDFLSPTAASLRSAATNERLDADLAGCRAGGAGPVPLPLARGDSAG
jgi:hypothetical protein